MATQFALQLVTADQLQNIYTAWGVTADTPRKSAREIVCWPNKEFAEITWTNKVSDYGKRLFQIAFFRT